jgi:hypothetical protein
MLPESSGVLTVFLAPALAHVPQARSPDDPRSLKRSAGHVICGQDRHMTMNAMTVRD